MSQLEADDRRSLVLSRVRAESRPEKAAITSATLYLAGHARIKGRIAAMRASHHRPISPRTAQQRVPHAMTPHVGTILLDTLAKMPSRSHISHFFEIILSTSTLSPHASAHFARHVPAEYMRD